MRYIIRTFAILTAGVMGVAACAIAAAVCACLAAAAPIIALTKLEVKMGGKTI